MKYFEAFPCMRACLRLRLCLYTHTRTTAYRNVEDAKDDKCTHSILIHSKYRFGYVQDPQSSNVSCILSFSGNQILIRTRSASGYQDMCRFAQGRSSSMSPLTHLPLPSALRTSHMCFFPAQIQVLCQSSWTSETP